MPLTLEQALDHPGELVAAGARIPAIVRGASTTGNGYTELSAGLARD